MTAWAQWADRWERFQSCYVPERAAQFRLIADYVADLAGPRPSVLDLGCGPGSLAGAVRERLPGARVVGVDLDPWLLALGRACGPPDVEWVEADLRAPSWTAALPSRRFDAVVSATALHWLEPERLSELYAEIAAVLAPAGVLLNADIIVPGSGTTAASAIARRSTSAWQEAHARADGGETWYEFWRAAEAEPAFADLIRLRTSRLGPRAPRVAASFEDHAERLRAAGFDDVGELWRQHAAAVLVATRA